MSIFANYLNQGGNRRGKLAPQPLPSYVEPWKFYYELTTAATDTPVTLAEARLHARIDDDMTDDDDLITALIYAATSTVEDITGRALMTQTWTAYLDCLPYASVLHLSKGRISSVNSIIAYDEDGDYEELDSDDYEIDTDNARIGLLDSTTWPTGTRSFKTFAVEYVTGYDSADDVPRWAKTAIKILVSHWYENREAATQDSQNEVPFGVQMILNTNKIARI